MKIRIFLVFILITTTTSLFAQSIIRITNGEWEPYMSEFSYKYGLASHIVSEAFDEGGITVEWGFYPWIRSYENAKKGVEWDASAVWWSTEETKKDFMLSVPVINSSIVFYHLKKNDFNWESIEDLKNLKIGITRGYDYGQEFNDALKNKYFSVDIANTDEQNYKKLLAGRIDIFPNDPFVGYSQIKNTFSPEEAEMLTHHSKIFKTTSLNLIISKKSKNSIFFMEKFNSGMRELKKSGKLDQMYRDLDQGKYDKQ